MDFAKLYLKNARSIYGKPTELCMLCDLNRYDFIILTETHLSPKTSNLFTPGYTWYRTDRSPLNNNKESGGGTLIQHEIVSNENLAVIRNVMSTLNHNTDTVLALGDFNLKSVKWKKTGIRMQASNLNLVSAHYRDFIKSMDEMGFSRINSLPNDNGRYLDLIFINNSA